MQVLVTGGTGFIGHALCRRLLADGHAVHVLSRRPDQVSARCGAGARGVADLDQLETDAPLDAVINLAGEPIADRRWTAARKQALLDSRLGVTQAVTRLIGKADTPPRVLVSASAIGYYGNTGAREVDEKSPPVNEFQHQLCRAWEEAAQAAESSQTRVCRLRLGVVLGPGGGALQKMLPPFRLGLGGPIGNGRQWMSWVHREDVLDMIGLLLQREDLSGAFNGTAPAPVMNRQFARELGRALGRPAVVPVPGVVLRAAFGELAHLLLTGQKVLPRRFQEAGYSFRFPNLPEAFADVLSG